MNRQILVGMVGLALTGCAQTRPDMPVARSGSRLPPVGLTPVPNIYEAINRENPRFNPASLHPENGPVLANLGAGGAAGNGAGTGGTGAGPSPCVACRPDAASTPPSGPTPSATPRPVLAAAPGSSPAATARPLTLNEPVPTSGPATAEPAPGLPPAPGPIGMPDPSTAPQPDALPALGPVPGPAPADDRLGSSPETPEADVNRTSAAPGGPEAPPASTGVPASAPAPDPFSGEPGSVLPPLPEILAAPPPALGPPETTVPPGPLPAGELAPLPPPDAKDPPAPDATLPAPDATLPAPAAPTTGAAARSEEAPTRDPKVVTASADPTAMHAEGTPVKLTEAGHVAARVGDEIITLNELTDAVKEKIASLPNNYKPNHQEIKMLTSQVLDMLIERSTIVQEAKRELKKPEQVRVVMGVADKAWREEELPPLLRKMGVENEYKLKEKLKEQGKSLDAMREAYRLEFLAQGYLHQKLGDKMKVSLSEMRDYYNSHLDSYHLPEQWTWREVVVELDKHASRAEARGRAEAILARLRHGDDFAKVAMAESEGPNRGKGGLWETAPDSYAVAAVNEAIRALPIGQVSTIIEGPSSYHIVRVESRRPAGPATFAEVQDKIRRLVFHQKARKANDAFFDKLRNQTVVTTIFDKTDFAPSATRPATNVSANQGP